MTTRLLAVVLVMSIAPVELGTAQERPPIRVGGELREPQKTKSVPMPYPSEAKASRTQDIVFLDCVIGADGKVRDVAILRGVPILAKAARAAVLEWEYTPTLLNGEPVPVAMAVAVTFVMDTSGKKRDSLLIAALKDSNPIVRARAAGMIGTTADASEKLLAGLRASAGDPDENVRRVVRRSLETIGGE